MREGATAVGGTFDRLHDGHKALLHEAFRRGKKVIVGLTSDSYVQKEGKVGVAPYARRRRELLSFLEAEGLVGRAKIVEITDRFGPILEDAGITDIVVTGETCETALEANRLREKKGMAPMKIHMVEMVLAKDKCPISSSRIRQGELDRQGKQVGKGIE